MDVEHAFKVLALWDWEDSQKDVIEARPKDPSVGWTKPNIPFVLTVPSDLRRRPNWAPQLTEPERDFDTDDEGDTYSYPLYDVSIPQDSGFETFIRDTEGLIKRAIEVPEWKFLDVALGFFMKAFLADGIEELLWHTVAVEALLGENIVGVGLTNLLIRRVKAILGPTAGKRFDDLYNLRSKIVHGDPEFISRAVMRVDLRNARQIARGLLLWFLSYADYMNANLPHGNRPGRAELLKPLDMDTEQIIALRNTLAFLPPKFPAI